MNKLTFKIQKQKGKARVGTLTLNGITIQTPIFMPVGTKASIKSVPYERLNASYLGSKEDISLVLNNTFHLHLRPGEETIHHIGGLHTFQQRNKLILTDSGGFQVFSLGLSKHGKSLVKIFDTHVEFFSPYDGSKHIFTPHKTIKIQRTLGSDIMMMLDVCSPVHHIDKDTVANHMNITHRRAQEQYEYHTKSYDKYRGVLFPIVQGGLYKDLREESASFLSSFARDGIAIGGLSVGETKQEMMNILQHLEPHLPSDKPRYLMGVGTPQDIYHAIYQGIDMFDCVMPTRLGRHGTAFSSTGNIKLRQSIHKNSHSPIDNTCPCFVCRTYTRSYLHHLVKEKEMMGASLLSFHNIAYLHYTIETIKQDILQG